HLVAYERDALRSAVVRSMRSGKRSDSIELGPLDERSRRVVRADDQHGARPAGERTLDGTDIDSPAAVVLEVVGPGNHAIQPRQMIEQGVARSRHEHFVARV